MSDLAKLRAASPTAVSVFLAACLSVVGNRPSHAQQSVAAASMPPAAQEILSRMEKEMAATRMKAMRELDKVLKETTKKGDLAGAMRVKEAMDRLRREVVTTGATFTPEGRWRVSTGTVVHIASNGSALSDRGDAGRWTMNGAVLHLEWPTGTRYEMQATPEGLAGTRFDKDGKRSASTWTRLP